MMKKINNLLILLIICLIPIGVSAKEENITIDFTKVYVEGKSIDPLQEQALLYLVNSGEISLINNIDINNLDYSLLFDSYYQNSNFTGYSNGDGKIILLYDTDNNDYIIPGGVGFNDNINVNVDKSSNLKYDTITIKFGEKKNKDTTLIVNMIDDKKLTDLSLKDSAVIRMLLENGLLEEQEDHTIISSKAKKLFSLNKDKLVVERGLTYKDNITYDLNKSDIELLNAYLGINSNYKQIKLIFENDSKSMLNSPKTFNIIVFPLAVLGLSMVLMAYFIYRNKKQNQDV